jgi:hypothetical protein
MPVARGRCRALISTAGHGGSKQHREGGCVFLLLLLLLLLWFKGRSRWQRGNSDCEESAVCGCE